AGIAARDLERTRGGAEAAPSSVDLLPATADAEVEGPHPRRSVRRQRLPGAWMAMATWKSAICNCKRRRRAAVRGGGPQARGAAGHRESQGALCAGERHRVRDAGGGRQERAMRRHREEPRRDARRWQPRLRRTSSARCSSSPRSPCRTPLLNQRIRASAARARRGGRRSAQSCERRGGEKIPCGSHTDMWDQKEKGWNRRGK
ncbi:unnamed protein product, partial [Urochloa humidicola]